MLTPALAALYNAKAPFDGNPQAGPALGLDLHKTLTTLCGVYDFATLGGAISTIKLFDDLGNPAVIPADAIIVSGMVYVKTAVTSAGSATVAVGTGIAHNDLLAATAKASLSLAALVDVVPVGTAATAVKMTAAGQLEVTVAVAALTAGKIYVFINYVRSPGL